MNPPADPGKQPSPATKPQSSEERPLLDILRSQAPEVLKDLPAQKREQLAHVAISTVSYRCGPLPDPQELATYNAIIPNGADRIMKMAEAQSAHRIEIEKTVIATQQALSVRGQIFGLVLGLCGLGLAAWMVYEGHPTMAVTFFGGTFGSLVTAFIFGKRGQTEDLRKKKPAIQSAPAPSQKKSGKTQRR